MKTKFSLHDCVTIIRNDGRKHFQIKSYQVSQLKTKLGFLGEYFKLKIKFVDQKEEEKRCFIKTLAVAESQKKFVLDNGAVTKEEAFYSKFLRKCLEHGADIIQECIAKCYLIKSLDLFVFDDLFDEGYRVLDARNCLSIQHIELALKTFAKFHAATYILEESLTRQNKVYRISDDFSIYLKEALYTDTVVAKEFVHTIKTGVRTHVEFFKAQLGDVCLEALTKGICDIVDKYRTYTKPSLKYRNVLCHGDLWTTNIMFKHENNVPVGCKMVDFQTYRYCPPTLDIITFLYFCTSRQFREEYFDDCIMFYFDQLSTILCTYNIDLETIFPRRDFMESVEYFKEFAVCQASTYGHLTMIDRKLLSDILCNSDSIGEIMLKDRSAVMVKMFENDNIYEQKLYEMLVDLTEVVACNNGDN